LLEDLRRRDVFLEADGGRLIVDAPTGAVTDELRASLARHKQALIKLLEWERRKLEDADRLGFVVKRSRKPGWISVHDPTTGRWHDFPTHDCFPSIVEEAKGNRMKGGAA
jgi:hypothetical protein